MSDMTAMTNGVSERQAALYRLEKLKSSWINFTDTLTEMIERQDHVTLGYHSFTEMWAMVMSELPLAGQFLVRVAYLMLAEGAPHEEIADAIHGAGPETIALLDQQREAGVPPEYASPRRRRKIFDHNTTIVHEHERVKPSAPRTIHIVVGELTLKRYERIARKYKTSVEDLARQAIDEKFTALS